MPGVALSLEGKVALITGGSRGIGAAAVRLFRQAGARVAFNYRTAHAAAEALAAECGGPDGSEKRCVAFAQDLASPENGRALVRRTVEAFGRIDILVANHGVWPPDDASIATMADDQWRSTLAINLDSVFGLVQAAVGAMQKQGRAAPAGLDTPAGPAGSIVLVSSTAGQRGEAFHADYAASKGAIISMTKGLATELAPAGIQVNCVAPGWVATDMSAPTLNNPETRDKVFRVIPLGRVADPMEIAGPILFLCTPLAGFMTGEIVNVNGGAVLVG
jgi:3-oxoacyl-[acyl-carrier protein] reductase